MTVVKDAQEQREAVDGTVERLARQVVQAINAGPTDGREILRELAIGVLRDEVEIVNDSVRTGAAPTVGTFNFLGVGIPLFLVGSVLLFLFPPIGLLFFGAAVLMIVCGLGVILFSRSKTT